DDQSQSQNEDLPVGFGLQDGRGAPNNSGYSGPGADSGMVWVRPVDAPPEEEGRGSRGSSDEMAFPTSFRAGSDLEQEASRGSQQPTAREEEDTLEPVYTVPENSTLMGSLGMTALLGRVPVDGTVNDPYPFKVVIGKDNLTANGIQVPELQSAVVSGTATGDWTLSCVRGNIDSMTFVFADGTIRTVPEPEDVNAGGGNSGSGRATTIGGGDSIGWI
ncbi:TIGR03752 family integrating conjugative element protein, partial [Halomonas sp. THAF12]|uniref:TIGR03752 family integrating conjugative element protein n=1 Tax=Halomonas sp. B23F22_10 TaxID=3459515 RepID=UPI00373EC84D